MEVVTTLDGMEFAEVAKLLGDAFSDNVIYQYIFDPDERKSSEEVAPAVGWLLARNVWLHLPLKCAYILRAGNAARHFPKARELIEAGQLQERTPVCFCMLAPARVVPANGWWPMLRAGLLRMPCLFGFGAVQRMFDVQGHYFRNKPTSPIDVHSDIELRHMVVSPALQGHGVGSWCLQAALDLLRQNWQSRLPITVVLSTQKQENVRFYTRNGFAMHDEQDVDFRTKQWHDFRMNRVIDGKQ